MREKSEGLLKGRGRLGRVRELFGIFCRNDF